MFKKHFSSLVITFISCIAAMITEQVFCSELLPEILHAKPVVSEISDL